MEEVIQKLDAQKLRGGYYTPKEIAKFLCKWSIQKDSLSLLEPSCGDGNFIEEAIGRFKELGLSPDEIGDRIVGVELNEEESLKADIRFRKLGIRKDIVVNSDFFQYLADNDNKKCYDVILGNPPFIRYQNFPEEHRVHAIKMMKDLGLKPNKLTNIWVPFLVISSSILTKDGKLSMVIPAELFQVKYAAETRIFLSKFFERITIVTFKKLVFADIQQEVVLLLCEKKVHHGKGIRVIECNGLIDLESINFNTINGSNVKPIDHSTEKWTKYFLEEKEIQLLKRLKEDPRIIPCSDIIEVDVGLVTGRNDFFMLTEQQVNDWNLKDFTVPVASKSNQLKGILFTNQDLAGNSEAQASMYLFIPPNKDFEDLPNSCQNYIKFGEEMGYNVGYKTRIRKRWYITPSLWIPEAFALRQVGDYPKIVLNSTKATSTDTIHRVRFKTGTDPKLVGIGFLNSISFAYSEITGRSYGGGVLTFEPTEIEEIRIPDLAEANINFDEVDSLIRQRRIEQVLDLVDKKLLIEHHGFDVEEIKLLREIWRKLANRRNNRRR